MAGTAAGDVPFAPGATASPGVSSAWGMGAGSGGGAAATATLSPSPENTPMLNAISIATITAPTAADRKSVEQGKRVSVRVDLGGRRNIKQKNRLHNNVRHPHHRDRIASEQQNID